MKYCFFIALLLCSISLCAQETQPQPMVTDSVDVWDDMVFTPVDPMPEFPGGMSALFDYLKFNTRYPKQAYRKGIEGRVVCQFVVAIDGKISNVEVVRSSGDKSLDREAVRVIRSMPKWKPGKYQGKPVSTKYSCPVTFKLK